VREGGREPDELSYRDSFERPRDAKKKDGRVL